MRTLVLWGVTASAAAVVYAFASFFLIVPVLRDEPLSLLNYGFEGLIFGLAYPVLTAIGRRVVGPGRFCITVHVVCGGISGLLSVAYAVVLTLHTAFGRSQSIMLDEMKRSIVLRTVEFSTGTVILGALVGLIVGLWKRRPPQHIGPLPYN